MMLSRVVAFSRQMVNKFSRSESAAFDEDCRGSVWSSSTHFIDSFQQPVTLKATPLVHEAYLSLLGGGEQVSN